MQQTTVVEEFPLGKGGRELVYVASVCAAMLAALFFRTQRMARTDAIFQLPWDWHKYIYMAQHDPLDFHIAPHCWRFLNSLLAKMLPFGVDTSFLVLTLLEIFLTGVLSYFLLKAWGFPQVYSLAGMVFFLGMADATRGPISLFWSVDQLSRLFMVATIYLILVKRPVWASITLAAGICAKDSVILGAPLYYLLTADRIVDWKKARQGVLFALPAVAAFLAIRHFIPEMGSVPAYANTLPTEVAQSYNGGANFGYWESLKVVIGWKIAEFSGWQLRALTVNAFGILFLLPFFAFRENRMPLLRWGPFILGTYLASLFSGSYERVLIICFPGVLIMALNGLEHLRQTAGVSGRWAPMLSLLLFPINLLYPKRIETFFEVQALVLILFIAAMLQWKFQHPARTAYHATE